jgi:glycosyltransferase involved in cell wall biosynthesis
MKELPEFNLYIAGTTFHSYAKDMLARIQNENLSERVFLIGTISNEEKRWMYEHAKGFVFPSLLEGFGMSIVEAQK